MAPPRLLLTIVTFAVLILFAVCTSLPPSDEVQEPDQLLVDEDFTGDDEPDSSDLPAFGLRRFLAKSTKPQTCDKNHKICKVKGSPGRDCCKKKCVDRKTDRLNCGRCGKKCKFTNTCCKGKCVNLAFDKNNCGSCGKKCHRGRCVYGICGYA